MLFQFHAILCHRTCYLSIVKLWVTIRIERGSACRTIENRGQEQHTLPALRRRRVRARARATTLGEYIAKSMLY